MIPTLIANLTGGVSWGQAVESRQIQLIHNIVDSQPGANSEAANRVFDSLDIRKPEREYMIDSYRNWREDGDIN